MNEKIERTKLNVKNIIAIASGKGGVGKSTISTNLAVSLASKGNSVGIIDADIYGPSLPKMFGVENERPMLKKIGDKDVIVPVEKFGVKMLSIGFFANQEDALVWRGPMASGALQQLIFDSDWGELDYLLIDLPPGTSDIHLTLVQNLALTGVVIVSTPQPIALADAIKGISMFTGKEINIPVLGIIENMAWFTPEELPENKYYIFGKNGGKDLSEKMKIPLLGQVPIIQSIRENSDNGKISALDKKPELSNIFSEITDKMIVELDNRNSTKPASKIVEMKTGKGCSH
ncbi:Mrp/NBP35 family ATP-binding protein [Bacteroidota bacterium]